MNPVQNDSVSRTLLNLEVFAEIATKLNERDNEKIAGA